jgi:hypothetical protein
MLNLCDVIFINKIVVRNLPFVSLHTLNSHYCHKLEKKKDNRNNIYIL